MLAADVPFSLPICQQQLHGQLNNGTGLIFHSSADRTLTKVWDREKKSTKTVPGTLL